MTSKTILSLLCASLLGLSGISFAAGTTSTPAKPIAAPASASAKLLDQVVAIVNNQVITSNQLGQAARFAKLQAQQLQLQLPGETSFKRQVLQQLIIQTIALQLAKINHISVSDQELNQALQRLAIANNMTLKQLQSLVAQHDMTFADYKNMIQQRLLITKLEQQAVANSIIITQSEIDNYLAQQTKASNPNTLYDVEHILITPTGAPTAANIAKAKQKAEQVAQDVRQGLPFSEAAIKYSQSGDALKGGDLGWQTLYELPTIFVKPVQSMHDGEIVGPFQTDSGFHIIKLVGKKTPPPSQHFVTEYNVSQIEVKVSPIKSVVQAKAEINQLRNEIVNGGKKFADVAKASSEDDNSNQQGGSLGWVRLANLPPKIAAQIPNLGLNTVSQPIEDGNGNWYLIEVTGSKQVNNTEEYMANQARMAIFQKKAAQALTTWQAQIRGASYVKIVDPTLRPSS